jgi:hypothetical protein
MEAFLHDFLTTSSGSPEWPVVSIVEVKTWNIS